ncbi:hypothetical protein OROGR_026462 [Orobanche gracilis]
MPASSSEAKARWRKRKRDYASAHKSKLNEHDNDDIFEDDEDEDDPDLDPPQNHLESEDDSPNLRTGQLTEAKEGEKLFGGGLRICEFPVAVKKQVHSPHLSVFRIVEAERGARNVDSRCQGQGGVAVLENISYGQLQALSIVPRDSPSLFGAPLETTASGSESGSYVVKPPRIIAGTGVTKSLGSAGRVHVVPVHSDWSEPNFLHRLERQVVPHFFSGKPGENTPEMYMECRNTVVAKYMENPEKHLSVTDCQELVAGIDTDDSTRIVRFLDNWGIINYCATPLKNEVQKEGTYLYEDSNSELRVPSAALKSTDSLIKFEKPTCRLKVTDVYPELACQRDEVSDSDWTIREQLSDYQCNCCTRCVPTVYYQSQKEVDVRLCHCLRGDDTGSNFIFLNSENPLMSLVAFLASALGPRVGAACAHASLASLSRDSSDYEGSPAGGNTGSQHDTAEGASLSVDKVRAAAKDGLNATAMKAKLFADHEEREIQLLSANIVNHQLKRLELKLKQFAEVETLLMRECEQMERARQRIAAERALIMSPQFGSPGVSRATSLPGINNSAANNHTSGNSRQQVLGSQQPCFVSGYGNNQQIHPQNQMSMMHQQRMYGFGPRLPLSAIHPRPTSLTSNAMYGFALNLQQPVGHLMHKPDELQSRLSFSRRFCWVILEKFRLSMINCM